MKAKLILSVVVVVFSGYSFANCTGTGSSYSCYDSRSGNSYNVQKFGNTTQMQGYNSNNGTSWSQSSNKIGNTTYQNGYDSDGNSWSQTSNKIGNSTFVNGTDSDGNSYSKTCNQFGCY